MLRAVLPKCTRSLVKWHPQYGRGEGQNVHGDNQFEWLSAQDEWREAQLSREGMGV